MRKIRDELSIDIMEMNLEQEQEYIKEKLAELKLKKVGR